MKNIAGIFGDFWLDIKELEGYFYQYRGNGYGPWDHLEKALDHMYAYNRCNNWGCFFSVGKIKVAPEMLWLLEINTERLGVWTNEHTKNMGYFGYPFWAREHYKKLQASLQNNRPNGRRVNKKLEQRCQASGHSNSSWRFFLSFWQRGRKILCSIKW